MLRSHFEDQCCISVSSPGLFDNTVRDSGSPESVSIENSGHAARQDRNMRGCESSVRTKRSQFQVRDQNSVAGRCCSHPASCEAEDLREQFDAAAAAAAAAMEALLPRAFDTSGLRFHRQELETSFFWVSCGFQFLFTRRSDSSSSDL